MRPPTIPDVSGQPGAAWMVAAPGGTSGPMNDAAVDAAARHVARRPIERD
jgi:hypothetical protein